jgi:hypothetical protein
MTDETPSYDAAYATRDRLCKLMGWVPGTSSRQEVLCRILTGKAVAVGVDKLDQLASEIKELRTRVTELTGHLDWLGWDSEKIERLREEAKWIRTKLGLPENAPFAGSFTADGTEVPTLAGAMHVTCSHAHGYMTYIESHRCDDKQGEIARLTVENKKLRERVKELLA